MTDKTVEQQAHDAAPCMFCGKTRGDCKAGSYWCCSDCDHDPIVKPAMTLRDIVELRWWREVVWPRFGPSVKLEIGQPLFGRQFVDRAPDSASPDLLSEARSALSVALYWATGLGGDGQPSQAFRTAKDMHEELEGCRVVYRKLLLAEESGTERVMVSILGDEPEEVEVEVGDSNVTDTRSEPGDGAAGAITDEPPPSTSVTDAPTDPVLACGRTMSEHTDVCSVCVAATDEPSTGPAIDMVRVPRPLLKRAIERLKLGTDFQDLPVALNLEPYLLPSDDDVSHDRRDRLNALALELDGLSFYGADLPMGAAIIALDFMERLGWRLPTDSASTDNPRTDA